MPHEYKFPMCSSTSTMVVFCQGDGTSAFSVVNKKVLLIKRRDAADAYPGDWALPGGFINVGEETSEACASRELKEETGIYVASHEWNLFGVVSDPKVDDRAHVINICYWYDMDNDAFRHQVKAGDDAQIAEWFDINKIYESQLAFNHNLILIKATLDWTMKNLYKSLRY